MHRVSLRFAGAAAFGWFLLAAPPVAATASGATALKTTKPISKAPISKLPPAQLLANAPAGLRKSYGGSPIDVTLYHYDNYRTGWNPTETDLTTASVASANFGLLAKLKVDGNVFAQPLLLSGFVMPDGTTHDVLIIATGHNTVYAFDAQTYSVLWQVSLGTAQNSNDVGCGDVVPEYGISSTPVLLRTGSNAATLYVVAATEPSKGNFETQLHALDIGTGLDVKPAVLVAPSATLSNGATVSFDPQNQWNRASLAYNNGSIYMGIGSHCDNNSDRITGWLLRYNTNLKLKNAFHTIETPHGEELASIWMTGFAPAINPSGNVYVVTGNGAFEGHGAYDWGESVLRLPPDLAKVKGRFTDSNYNQLNANDVDFGSGGVMLLPPVAGQTGPNLAAAMGKSGDLFLLNSDNLGGLKPNNGGALQIVQLSGLWGGPAYANASNGPTLYIQGDSDALHAFTVTTGATPGLTQANTGTSFAGYGGSLPIVSSNGTAPGTAIVWLIRRSSPIEIEAYDAAALGTPIFTANTGNWSNGGQGNPFLTPMEANGRVYVPGYKTVEVFGLAP
ncbi:MAG TPA: hypothetical protein VMB71_05200 [Acetobacteraceae bacterium]|nr:hypothetical protein [Acetobacteraceae bacterium]